jgi:Nucleotide-diphospho-sugar transferase
MQKLYINALIFLCCFIAQSFSHDKIKLYALYTPSHEILKDQFFLPSLHDDFELIFEFCEQTCPSAKFMEEGWTETTMRKVDLIIRAIKENWDSIFIFSDVDIQFFTPIQDIILKHMHNKDMVIQKNTPWGVLCSGFFACRGNAKTLKLWMDVKKRMEQDGLSDQITLNRCIKRHSKKNPYDIVWDYLPSSFFGAGTLTGRLWRPGMTLPIPKDIVMHHANWTNGIKNKIAQLNYVRNVVQKRKKRTVKKQL